MSFVNYEPFAYRYKICCDCTDEERKILQFVHPLQQKVITEIIHNADFTNVVKCILIGSSITMRCGIFSDVDLVVFTENNDDTEMNDFCRSIASFDAKIDCIIGNHFDETDRMWNEIQNGLVIWERS